MGILDTRSSVVYKARQRELRSCPPWGTFLLAGELTRQPSDLKLSLKARQGTKLMESLDQVAWSYAV